jgi:hypothetical protein
MDVEGGTPLLPCFVAGGWQKLTLSLRNLKKTPPKVARHSHPNMAN